MIISKLTLYLLLWLELFRIRLYQSAILFVRRETRPPDIEARRPSPRMSGPLAMQETQRPAEWRDTVPGG